jgi:hypothetical protein
MGSRADNVELVDLAVILVDPGVLHRIEQRLDGVVNIPGCAYQAAR